MNSSDAYVELVNRTYSRSRLEGCRPYPVACFEIMLLNHAQKQAEEKEKAIFHQLCHIFDWQLTRREINNYLNRLKMGFTLILTDTSRTILWASHSMLSMTGYSSKEVLGRTPHIFQGTDTNALTVDTIRKHLRQELPVKVDLTNYRKNGEPYQCNIQIDPLRNSQGQLTHFLAVEHELK